MTAQILIRPTGSQLLYIVEHAHAGGWKPVRSTTPH